MRIPTKKKKKLEHYGRLENPMAFIQLLTYLTSWGILSYVRNANGLSATVSCEYELMSGVYDVRIIDSHLISFLEDIARYSVTKTANFPA